MSTEYEKYTEYYLKQEIKKCRYCGHYIESGFVKVLSNRVNTYYHNGCYEIFKRNLELLYSS